MTDPDGDRREPVWIEKSVALAIHDRQLAEHGGGTGVRDDGLLESGLARLLNQWAVERNNFLQVVPTEIIPLLEMPLDDSKEAASGSQSA